MCRWKRGGQGSWSDASGAWTHSRTFNTEPRSRRNILLQVSRSGPVPLGVTDKAESTVLNWEQASTRFSADKKVRMNAPPCSHSQFLSGTCASIYGLAEGFNRKIRTAERMIDGCPRPLSLHLESRYGRAVAPSDRSSYEPSSLGLKQVTLLHARPKEKI
jgi:hypothetical protein